MIASSEDDKYNPSFVLVLSVLLSTITSSELDIFIPWILDEENVLFLIIS